MRFSIIAAVCGVLTGVVASPTPNAKRHVVHERRERLPTNWRRSAELHGNTLLPLRIALTQRNLDKAHEFLMDVSHPESPNFGNHWTPKQVAEAFAPSDEAVSSVLDWLAETGISPDRVKQSQGLNWLHAEVTVEEAENLLRTKYYRYMHSRTGQAHVACEEYSIPEQIQQHVDFITPTVHFDAKVAPQKKRRAMHENEIQIAKRQISAVNHEAESRKKRSLGSPGSWSQPKSNVDTPPVEPFHGLQDCDVSIVPECLRALYYLPNEFISHPNNSYGIVEYTPQAYLPSDLDMFFRNFSPPLVGQRPILESIDGGFLQTTNESFGYNSESNLDIEYAMALVYPQQVTVYQTGDDVEGASFNNFLDALDASYCTFEGGDDPNEDGIYPDPLGGGYEGPEDCGTVKAANVISTSYGFNEVDLTPFYAERQCHEYLKLGLQGTTFVFSSGDYGVAGEGGQCIDPTTGKTGSNSTCSMFNPSFPSTCPYVTAVGATQIKPNASVTQPEKAAESYIYSGGGFSNVFSTPGYQASALKTYFAHHKPPYGPDRYNTTEKSRGYPDVSANGVNYVVSVDGTFNHVYGTSASAPTFGSIVTLINAARMYVGKGPVGFMNPALYANPGMMNDIVSGGNQGCGTPGFKAVDGWDPVTGLGTPNFPKMLGYFLALP